jgi:acyl-ACP thioesterase
MKRYPVFREKITIRTWMSQYTTVKGYRENVIYDEDGEIIGSGRCLWLFYDIKRKRPVKIFDEIKTTWSVFPPESSYDIDEKILMPETFTHLKQLYVCNYDMDMNNHVNNLRYLQWLLETVPQDVAEDCYVNLFELRFLKEAYHGDKIESCTAVMPNCFIHSINNLTNGQPCTIGRSTWKKRASVSDDLREDANEAENQSWFSDKMLIK